MKSEINHNIYKYTSNKMGGMFAKEKPLKEIVRENQRMIKKAVRELEKEISQMKKNEVSKSCYNRYTLISKI